MGVSSATLFLTQTELSPAGTLSRGPCGFDTQSWAFTAWSRTDVPLTAQIRIEGLGYARGTTMVHAEPYVAYNGQISISPMASATASQTCATPASASFNWLSMYARKRAVSSEIKAASTVLFQSTNREMPGAHQTAATPFSTFSTNVATLQLRFREPVQPNHPDRGEPRRRELRDAQRPPLPRHQAGVLLQRSGAALAADHLRLHNDDSFAFSR